MQMKTVEVAVNAMFNRISDALAASDRVELRGFGAFTVVTHRAHTGRNPRTGASVNVPEKSAVRFKAAKATRKL